MWYYAKLSELRQRIDTLMSRLFMVALETNIV
jgi:hypothetical protein